MHTQVWPRSTAPTPAGVPEKIRSPGARVNSPERQAMISGVFQISWLRSPAWRRSPSTPSQMAPLDGVSRVIAPDAIDEPDRKELGAAFHRDGGEQRRHHRERGFRMLLGGCLCAHARVS
jgi:hypothetical protein